MLIGYARVSKNEQNLDLQRDALLKAGCDEKNIFTDKITGTNSIWYEKNVQLEPLKD